MTYDVITIGSGVVDAFMETALPEKDGKIMLPVGSKVVCNDIWFATGGGGTNTATAFSRLGFRVGFLGILGRDKNAEMVLSDLKKEKIYFLGRQVDEPTGYSVVVNSVKKNRTILTHKGANSNLEFGMIKLRKLKTKWFYFSAMIGESMKTQERLAKIARRKNIRVAYNPSSYLTKHGDQKIKGLLRNVDILVLNEEEAKHLVKRGKLSDGLMKLGPRIVCITNGNKGSVVCDGIHRYKAIPNKVRIHEKTGAGDAFASGFVAGLIKFNDVEDAIQVGSLNAESVIQNPGAKNGLLDWNGIKRDMKRKPVRILKAMI
jgi:ribokinase